MVLRLNGAQARSSCRGLLGAHPTPVSSLPHHTPGFAQQAVSREEETSKVLSLWLEGADEENQPFLRSGGGHCIQLPSHENTLTLGPLFHI